MSCRRTVNYPTACQRPLGNSAVFIGFTDPTSTCRKYWWLQGTSSEFCPHPAVLQLLASRWLPEAAGEQVSEATGEYAVRNLIDSRQEDLLHVLCVVLQQESCEQQRRQVGSSLQLLNNLPLNFKGHTI